MPRQCEDGIVYAVRFKNVSEPWRQSEARAYPSALERRLKWRASPPPWRDREMRARREREVESILILINIWTNTSAFTETLTVLVTQTADENTNGDCLSDF